MSKASDFFSKDEPEPEEILAGLPVGGAFSCAECDNVSTQAMYSNAKLTWVCADGHKNSIGMKL